MCLSELNTHLSSRAHVKHDTLALGQLVDDGSAELVIDLRGVLSLISLSL